MDNILEICSPAKDKQVLRIQNNTRLLARATPRAATVSNQLHTAIDKLVLQLFLSSNRGVSVVVFSAVEHGSGCSWTCARTAEILASRTDRMVCLIDANFRTPGLCREFEFEDSSEPAYEEEWTFAPVARHAERKESNLWLLSYKPSFTLSPSVSSVQGFRMRLSDLRQDFAFVLIDAPPLNEYADAASFGQMADGVVMVLAANSTRRERARTAKQMLDDCGVPVLGAVLNKRVFPIPERLYRRL